MKRIITITAIILLALLPTTAAARDRTIAYADSYNEWVIIANQTHIGTRSQAMREVRISSADVEDALGWDFAVVGRTIMPRQDAQAMGADAATIFAVVYDGSIPGVLSAIALDGEAYLLLFMGWGFPAEDMVEYTQDVLAYGITADPPRGFHETETEAGEL